jgi:hypothetical protein
MMTRFSYELIVMMWFKENKNCFKYKKYSI